MTISKQQMLAKAGRRIKPVDIVGLGTVQIQSLTGREMRVFKSSLLNKSGDGLNKRRSDYMSELLIANCLLNGDDGLMFSEKEVLGGAIDELDGAVITQLASEIKDHTGLSEDSDFAAIETEVKNSGPTHSDSSS